MFWGQVSQHISSWRKLKNAGAQEAVTTLPGIILAKPQSLGVAPRFGVLQVKFIGGGPTAWPETQHLFLAKCLTGDSKFWWLQMQHAVRKAKCYAIFGLLTSPARQPQVP